MEEEEEEEEEQEQADEKEEETRWGTASTRRRRELKTQTAVIGFMPAAFHLFAMYTGRMRVACANV